MTNGTTKVWRFNTYTAIQDPSVSNSLDVQVSPNPFVSSFTIHNNNSERPLSIRLFNAISQLVFTEKNVQNNAIITPPQHLSKGLYLLDISCEEKRITKRLIKL
jgi:Secretion system C-terminal sorting domain